MVKQAIRTQGTKCGTQAQENPSHQSLGILRRIPWTLKNGTEVLQAKTEVGEDYLRRRKKQVAQRHGAAIKSGRNSVRQELCNPPPWTF